MSACMCVCVCVGMRLYLLAVIYLSSTVCCATRAHTLGKFQLLQKCVPKRHRRPAGPCHAMPHRKWANCICVCDIYEIAWWWAARKILLLNSYCLFIYFVFFSSLWPFLCGANARDCQCGILSCPFLCINSVRCTKIIYFVLATNLSWFLFKINQFIYDFLVHGQKLSSFQISLTILFPWDCSTERCGSPIFEYATFA